MMKQQFEIILVQMSQKDKKRFQAFVFAVIFMPFTDIFTRQSFQIEKGIFH